MLIDVDFFSNFDITLHELKLIKLYLQTRITEQMRLRVSFERQQTVNKHRLSINGIKFNQYVFRFIYTPLQFQSIKSSV